LVIRLRVPGNLRYRDLAVRVVAAACKLVGREDDDSEEQLRDDRQFDAAVVSSFGEAFNNVSIHSYRGSKGDLEIEIEVFSDRITIRLIDYGITFDPMLVPEPDLAALPESGMGIYIMRSFMDDVTYKSGSPNVLSMTKYLNKSSRQLEQPGD
jgi:serine/threonine-protein kinase RsbW